jgi:glycosyltransferase involved in cell wall biosynthesis
MNRIDVSIIITTKNEERRIGDCLRSIQEQNYPQERLEIIIVDNNSIDNTKKIASRFNVQVYNKGPERSAQRNFGIFRAKGEYVLYLDADMTLGENVIPECVRNCDDNGCTGLYIPERIIGKGFWIRVRDFERGFYDGTCIDAARFIRRETAMAIGGFDESLNGPEDWDFDRRLRAAGKLGIACVVIFHDEGTFNLWRYLTKKRYYSRGFAAYISKWGKNDSEIRKQFGFRYRYLGVFIENGKWKRLLVHSLLAGGMILLRLAVGLMYISSRWKSRS